MASINSSVQYLHSLTLPSAINYASVFSAQATATYSAVSTGASPGAAVLASVTAISPGTGAAGSPPDPNEQGNVYNVDHILELQFVVGAFQVNPRPYVHIFPRDPRAHHLGERGHADTNHKIVPQALHRSLSKIGIRPPSHASRQPEVPMHRKFIPLSGPNF